MPATSPRAGAPDESVEGAVAEADGGCSAWRVASCFTMTICGASFSGRAENSRRMISATVNAA